MTYLFAKMAFECCECGNTFTASGYELCAGIVLPVCPCQNCGSRRAMPYVEGRNSSLKDIYMKIREATDTNKSKKNKKISIG